ncbi:MAG: DUF6933 domain-containing protein [Steroidobacteraceae bacterium]
MITLRCTQKVRKRLRLAARLLDPLPPTTALGDWYVNLVRFGRQQVIMATSERSLLTVLLPARELRQSLVPNLRRAVQDLLTALGIPPDTVSREIAAMQPTAYANAVNRRVLGSMNDFAKQIGAYLDRTGDALELARELSDTPMSAVGSKSRLGIPADVARELLAAHYAASPFRH